MLDELGLRWSCLIGSGLCFFGAGIRCFTTDTSTATGLIYFGQFLNGLAGPLAMSVAPAFSATWFRPEERTTATGIQSAANNFGAALGFLLGPQLISTPPTSATTALPGNYTTTVAIPTTIGSDIVHTIKHQYLFYVWLQTAFTAMIFIGTIVYFPNRPPNSPSRTADISRISFFSGIKQLLGHRQFWLIALAYGAINGVSSGWSGYMEPNLQAFLPESTAQDESGWMGFYGTVGGCLGGIVFGYLSDKFIGRMKTILLVLCLMSSVFYMWFSLACQKIVPNRTADLYASSIIGNIALGATIPLFYELGVETTYPIAEGITTGLLTTVNNVCCLLFLIFPEIPGMGSIWANWLLVGSCAFSFFVLLVFREQYRRMSVDLSESAVDERDGAINAD